MQKRLPSAGSTQRDQSKTEPLHENTVGAAQAKAHFLRIANRVQVTAQSVTVTKRGVPFVQVTPVEPARPVKSIIGCMKGTATIVGDIVGPEPDVWEALS